MTCSWIVGDGSGCKNSRVLTILCAHPASVVQNHFVFLSSAIAFAKPLPTTPRIFAKPSVRRGVLCGQRGGEQRQGSSENEADLLAEWTHHNISSPRIVPFDVGKASVSMPSRWSIER